MQPSDYLADHDAVEIMGRDAPRVIYELKHMGVLFSCNSEGRIAQRNFGGHTSEYGKKPVKKTCYASDRTGRVVLADGSRFKVSRLSMHNRKVKKEEMII